MDPVFQRLGDVTIQRLDKPKDKVGLQGGGDTVDDESKEDPQQDVNTEDSQGIKRNFENLAGPSNKRTKFEFKKGLDESSIQSFSDAELTDYDSESEIESDEESEAIMKSQTQESTEVTSELETSTDFLNQLVDDPYQTEEAEEMKNPEEIKSEVDDYEYDIKEKLKEMGEISFETVKKGDKPKKSEVTPENEVSVTPAKKPVLSNEDEMNERKTICGNLRRNIREVMDETKLDESTLAAQRQEMERLRRVQEQQRILRDYQRQIQQERVISLLQGNTPKAGTSGARIGSTVLVKLPNGQTMTKVIKKPFELVKVPKSAVPPHKSPKSLIAIKKPPGNLTPSVSIAPVMKRPSQIDRMFSDTDSDSEDAMSIRPPMQKTKPKDPVTTIDISSDDDCIVVSESENDPSEDADEDPSNSGLHTNDEFNQLDGQGRVVVNVGHAEDEADVYVAPQIARIIKPHQIGGVRFLFDNVIESVNRFETSTGFGCILAHSMGLGKTLQIVCFSDIFLRHTPSRTILCIMPINTLQNWLAEYNMWLPVEEAVPNSPLSAHGEVRPRNFNLHVLNDSHKTLAARAKVIHEWKTAGGVLLIGYEQFRLLSLRKHPKSRKKAHVIEPVDDDKSKLLFDDVHEALVKPGPDLVICDEGHRIKNSHASISQALKQMRTKRRVVLTGYPLQNNLMEYWCMVDFVRPNYLGTKTEFCNMFERPIQNGQCIDSTEADIKLMRYRAHVLHSLLVGFVQRRSHTVLQTALPQKEEYVLLVRMTNFQRTLYETFMNEVVRTQTVPNPLKAFAVCCKIWNHPDVLYYFLKKQAGGEAVDIDLEEVSTATTTANETTAKPKKGSKKSTAKGKNASKPAASVTPYNSLGDATSKSTKKNQGKNNQNNANQVQPCPQANLTEPNPNYQAQSQNYPAKMDFEYSNSSGYGSNQSFGSSNFQQNQNYGETPSYPYSNQNTPSQPTYPVSGTPHSDTNIYPYQQNNNTNQNYQSDSQGYPANQNQNFEQKPNFHGKGNDFPQTQNQYPQNNPNQGSSYNNSNSNQSITYGQNSQNYHNQQPKGPYPQHQNNYPPNQQGPYPQTQDAYPQGEQENFRGSESNFSQQENAASFQNQQNPSAGYSGTTPYNNTQGNYGNQSVNSEYSNQSTLKHDGNRPGYSGYSNSSLGKGVYQENQGYPPQQQPSNVPQQQVPNVLQQPNVSQQLPCAPQQQQPKAPQLQTNSHNTQGYPQNSPAGYSTSNTHNMPPQSHTTPPHGHNHQQHMSPPQNPGVPYDPHPQGVAHPSNTAHLQTVSHPQNVHPQNLTHSQSAPHPQHTSHPQNIPPVHTSPHPQSTSQGSSSMYPQHHHNQENSLMGTGSNPGYSPQHHQGSVTIPQGMGHPQNVDGYPQNVGQSLASGGHPQNVGGHSQNIGHTQSIQHSQNAPHSQSVASYPQNVGHSQHVSNSQNIGIPQNVSASQNIGHSHNAGHHTGATQLGTNPNTSVPPQNVHSQQQIGGSPLQSIRDQPQNVSGHLQNVGGHNQSIGGQPGQHQHVSGQNLGGQHQNVSGQHQNVGTNPQNMGYNPQNTGETSPNIAGNPHSFAGNSQNTGGPHHSSGHLHNTGHHPGNAQLHNIAGQQQSGTPLSNIGGQHSSIGAQHLSLGSQHSSSGGQHQSGGHHSLMSGPHQSQNIIGGNPVEPSQNVDRLQQNMVGGQHSHITGQHSNVSQQQSGGHAQSIASSNPIEHSQNVDRSQHNIAAGHNSQKQHGGNYGQDKYGGYSQNVAHSQTASYSQNVNQPQSTGSQNLGHPQNLVHPQNSGHLQNVPPQSINHPQNVPPPQNSSPSQNVNPPQTASGNYQHNYPPQSPQPYPPNVTTPHYNSAPTPNPDNQNYPPTSDQQNSYPNSQGSQTQPPYQHSQGYQQQQPNAYQGNGQGEYRGNQYNETQYHGNASQNFPAGNSPKAYQSGAATPSYQTNQQNEEYSSTHSDSYPQNQPSNYPQQQSGYQNNSPNQPAGGYQQNQYSANYQGGNNNQTGNFSNNQTGGSNYNQNNPVQTTTNKDKGFPQGYKQEVPESPTNYSTNQNQQQSQFQPPANFQNYPNQQQSPYWNQDYNKQNENYNFKPPFNQNYQNQSQPWKKEDCGNKQSPAGSICPSPVKSENSCDSKPKINIISDIKLSGSSAYDMNKKINILSDIKLEPKKENEEFKEEIKLEVKNDTLKQEPSDDDIKIVEAAPATKAATKEDTGIPYDWAIELLKDYVPGIIENSAKMEILFCIIKESIALGDRLLVFSQSLITLDLIEQFLQMNSVPGETQHWAKNVNYYRLDGSTSALEREKLINEFNSNPKIYVFLVSTRAGSLGINLIGANRVVVLDASWNPCHDTQAVCRVYRYGQRKPCFVYRLVVDNCLEKKIYDRQINKQGMSDRVVDECNPDAHLTMKDVSTLCWDDKTEEGEEKDWSHYKDNYIDVVLQKVLVQYGKRLNKEPFQHESLLVDRKDKQLSQQEKRLAKKGYEREKQAARQPSYNVGGMSRGHRPVASVRPMQQGGERPTRWIPAEHWQRQGMTAQEMTLPLDVVIPTNQPDKGNIVLKAGQKVLVLKSPKGVYMQLESGKIVAIKTAIKVRGKVDEDTAKAKAAMKNAAISVVPQKRVVKPFTPNLTKLSVKSIKQSVPNLVSRMQTVAKRVQTAKTKPYNVGQEIARAVNQAKSETESHPSSSDEERTHGGEKRHFNFSKENMPLIDSKRSAQNSRNSSLDRREMSTDGEDAMPPVVVTPTLKPKNVKQSKGSMKNTTSALERLEQSASTIMAKNKQTFQESLDTITSTYAEDEKLSEASHSAPNQSSQSISSSSEPEVIPVDDAPYSESEPSSTTASDVPKSDIPAPDYGYNYYSYGHGHMPYPPPPQGYPGYPPQPYDMMGYQQPQYNYGMYPPQGYPPPPQGYPQGPYDYQPPPHPQAPVYPGYPPYPPQQYPPPPQGMYPPPGAPPPAPGYDYGYGAPHGAAPPPAAPYYPGH